MPRAYDPNLRTLADEYDETDAPDDHSIIKVDPEPRVGPQLDVRPLRTLDDPIYRPEGVKEYGEYKRYGGVLTPASMRSEQELQSDADVGLGRGLQSDAEVGLQSDADVGLGAHPKAFTDRVFRADAFSHA